MRMFKKTLLSTAVAGSLIAGSMVAAPAMAGVSMNVGATSNYVWRGMTQTTEGPAIQGGIDYAHDSGFYVGTWASNIDWTGVPGYEIDFYAGFGGEFAEDWAYDVGYVYYMYPVDNDATEADFGELYGSIGWKGLTLFGAYQTNEQASDVEDIYYVSLDYLFEYGDGMSSDFLVGYYGGDGIKDANDGDAYMHYYADVSKSTDYGDLSLALSIADYADDTGGVNDPRVIVSWAKEF
jgi:uncharacterized protein (TIGR02001 family)